MGDYELYHANRKHKYIKKIGDRYFYTQEELNAYYQDPKSGKKKTSKLNEVKEAVAEATGRRDVYFEAPKVTENGRTFYDDDNAKLRRGKKDKNGKVGDDGTVYTKNSMQYDNRYTEERNKKTRARGRKKLKKMATSPIRSLKKKASRGKNAIDKYYTKLTTPSITVTYDEAKLK